jgi:hypothetical protein
MINGFDKLLNIEFKFPIMNAEHAMYKVKTVNEVKDEGKTKWYGVLGCKYQPDHNVGYVGMPDYIVFTIEPVNYSVKNKYKISAMITNLGSQVIEVNKNEIDTMANFVLQLKRLALLFDKTSTI